MTRGHQKVRAAFCTDFLPLRFFSFSLFLFFVLLLCFFFFFFRFLGRCFDAALQQGMLSYFACAARRSEANVVSPSRSRMRMGGWEDERMGG